MNSSRARKSSSCSFGTGGDCCLGDTFCSPRRLLSRRDLSTRGIDQHLADPPRVLLGLARAVFEARAASASLPTRDPHQQLAALLEAPQRRPHGRLNRRALLLQHALRRIGVADLTRETHHRALEALPYRAPACRA